MTAIAGYKGSVKFDSAPAMRAHRFIIDFRVQDFDISSFVNEGVGDYLPGLLDADVMIDCYYDSDDDPFNLNGSLKLTPGTYHSLRLSYDNASAPQRTWLLPRVLIVQARNEAGVRDVVNYQLTLRLAGRSPTLPTE
jgi:hypothetical protein